MWQRVTPVSSGTSFRGLATAEFKEIEMVEERPITGMQKLDNPSEHGGLRVSVKQTNNHHIMRVNPQPKNIMLYS